jgi:hypothetical protein
LKLTAKRLKLSRGGTQTVIDGMFINQHAYIISIHPLAEMNPTYLKPFRNGFVQDLRLTLESPQNSHQSCCEMELHHPHIDLYIYYINLKQKYTGYPQ